MMTATTLPLVFSSNRAGRRVRFVAYVYQNFPGIGDDPNSYVARDDDELVRLRVAIIKFYDTIRGSYRP